MILLEGVAPRELDRDRGVKILRAKHRDITAELIAREQPDLVVAPLVGVGFDGVDVAQRLTAAGFKGQFLVVASTLPSPAIVRREIAAQFPALDFDLIVLGRDQ